MTDLKITSLKLYKEKFKELIKFLISPNIDISSNQSIKNNIKDTVALLALKVFIALFFAIITVLLFDAEKIGLEKLKNEFSPFIILLLGGFLAPLLEETAFRLYLLFKPVWLSVSATVLSFYFISKFYFKTSYLNLDDSFLLRIMISILIGIIIFFISKAYSNRFNFFWKKNFKWIYYFSIILFAFVHITNYEMNTKNLLLMPILTLPQLVGGIFTGFVRIKYGFIYACLFHITNNLFALSFSITF